MKSLLAIIIFYFCYSTAIAQVYQEYLLSSWTFQVDNKGVWLPAEVPGSFQNDLTLNGRNPANAVGDSVTYRTSFIIDEYILAREHIELRFEGLDAKAAVYVNKQLVLEANNMFRSWTVPIKPIIKKGENTLEIIFDNSIRDLNTSVVRKAAYHLQKNDEPSTIPVGIWKPIILQSWDTYKLNDAFIKQNSLNSKEASLTAIVHLQGRPNSKLQLEIYNEVNDRVYERHEVILGAEEQQFEIPFTIRKPNYWSPAPLGNPELYLVGVRVKNGSNVQSLVRRIGLRNIDVIPADNTQELSVKVNGTVVPLRVFNYTPTTFLTSNIRSTEYNAFFDKLIHDQITVLRVTGNGIYESDYFYDLADTKGILVIQDFMFSENQYSTSPKAIDNIKAEAKENIIRLKQHSSLFLWTAGHNLNAVTGGDLVNILSDMVQEHNPSRPFIHYLPSGD